jgi:hypothetical protein
MQRSLTIRSMQVVSTGLLLSFAGGARAGTPCVTLQEGVFGNVATAKIEEASPNTNFGSSGDMITGQTPGTYQESLLWFDVSPAGSGIPAGAVIVSAEVSLFGGGGTPATLNVHDSLVPWSQYTVTWASYDQQYSPAVVASFESTTAGSTMSFDATALVQAWVTGTNDGLLLEQAAPDYTGFATSEYPIVAERPALTVCYETANECNAGNSFSTDGLSALWKFDDGAPTATDSSGNGNTGSFIGEVAYDYTDLPPIAGNVASLDVNDGGYVSVPSSPSLVIPGSLSVAAWVRIESPSGEHNIMSKDTPGNAFSNYNLHVEGNNPYFCLAFDTGGATGGVEVASPAAQVNGTAMCDTGGCCIASNASFIDATHPAGTWRLETGVYDNAAKTLSVYLDCEDVAVGTFATAGVAYTSGETVQIGLRKWLPSATWTGGVDNVAIWSRALSPAEVTGSP